MADVSEKPAGQPAAEEAPAISLIPFVVVGVQECSAPWVARREHPSYRRMDVGIQTLPSVVRAPNYLIARSEPAPERPPVRTVWPSPALNKT